MDDEKGWARARRDADERFSQIARAAAELRRGDAMRALAHAKGGCLGGGTPPPVVRLGVRFKRAF